MTKNSRLSEEKLVAFTSKLVKISGERFLGD